VILRDGKPVTQPVKAPAELPGPSAALVAKLVERIEALERRLAELERAEHGPDAAAL
jgi:hypothetical protein